MSTFWRYVPIAKRLLARRSLDLTVNRGFGSWELVFGLSSIVMWSDKPKGGRLSGILQESRRLVRIKSRVYWPLVGKRTIYFSLKLDYKFATLISKQKNPTVRVLRLNRRETVHQIAQHCRIIRTWWMVHCSYNNAAEASWETSWEDFNPQNFKGIIG